nr:MAG TPA: hypothetical protein [Caudoviricetes sp.]
MSCKDCQDLNFNYCKYRCFNSKLICFKGDLPVLNCAAFIILYRETACLGAKFLYRETACLGVKILYRETACLGVNSLMFCLVKTRIYIYREFV